MDNELIMNNQARKAILDSLSKTKYFVGVEKTDYGYLFICPPSPDLPSSKQYETEEKFNHDGSYRETCSVLLPDYAKEFIDGKLEDYHYDYEKKIKKAKVL